MTSPQVEGSGANGIGGGGRFFDRIIIEPRERAPAPPPPAATNPIRTGAFDLR